MSMYRLNPSYLALITLVIMPIQNAHSQQVRPFSVRDDIELTQFGDIYRVRREDVVQSFSGHKVVVHTTRGSLEDGKLHDQLRVYDTDALRSFVNGPDRAQRPEPLWVINESTAKSGQDQPLITRIRWLRDDSGVAFLLRSDQDEGLYLDRIGSGEARRLSPPGTDVLSFDINDESHYVLALASRETKEDLTHKLDAPFRVSTGLRIFETMFPEVTALFVGRAELWAANGGPPSAVHDSSTGKPIIIYESGSDALALSPDGSTVLTIRPAEEIPNEWESRFPPPFLASPYRLLAGHQNLNAASGASYVGDYIRIDLASGHIVSLTNAPESGRAGWWESLASPAWSDDSSSVILPGTFDADHHRDDLRPCVVVVRVANGASECVTPLKRNLADGFEAGYERIEGVSFVHGRQDEVLLENFDNDGGSAIVKAYIRSDRGEWHLDEVASGLEENPAFEVKVGVTFKDPPVLIGIDNRSKKSRTIVDPNPQLKQLMLGEAEPYAWTDGAAQSWEGILYKPVGYHAGIRYPLVIQNHGYSTDRFSPSGGFPSAFAAQELASAGIMVLHVRDCDGRSTPIEGPCNVREYEAAVDELSRDGLIDSSRVGIIGFSRTVFYVLEALTTSRLRFKAASITQGITLGYMDYLSAVGPSDIYRKDAEAIIGSAPYGQGLNQWLRASPDFNMDKVASPLRVVAEGNDGAIEMWEPYALLEALHKPVDLIILNTSEHVITEPAVRLAAQGGNVDWFRFWLQGYEDPDPSKKDQYTRWEHLRELQEQNDAGQKAVAK
jgi:dipeptidyl aminopeptidase/acylaminoacyl peptidase